MEAPYLFSTAVYPHDLVRDRAKVRWSKSAAC